MDFNYILNICFPQGLTKKKTILKKKKKAFVHNLSTIRVLLLCKTLILKPLSCPQKFDDGRLSISIPKISQETFMQVDVINHPHKRRVVRLQVGNEVQVHCTPECS